MKVTIYSALNCGPCAATKSVMHRVQIEYTEADSADFATQLRALGFTSAPVVIIQTDSGTLGWSGFRPNLISKLVAGTPQGIVLGTNATGL